MFGKDSPKRRYSDLSISHRAAPACKQLLQLVILLQALQFPRLPTLHRHGCLITLSQNCVAYRLIRHEHITYSRCRRLRGIYQRIPYLNYVYSNGRREWMLVLMRRRIRFKVVMWHSRLRMVAIDIGWAASFICRQWRELWVAASVIDLPLRDLVPPVFGRGWIGELVYRLVWKLSASTAQSTQFPRQCLLPHRLLFSWRGAATCQNTSFYYPSTPRGRCWLLSGQPESHSHTDQSAAVNYRIPFPTICWNIFCWRYGGLFPYRGGPVRRRDWFKYKFYGKPNYVFSIPSGIINIATTEFDLSTLGWLPKASNSVFLVPWFSPLERQRISQKKSYVSIHFDGFLVLWVVVCLFLYWSCWFLYYTHGNPNALQATVLYRGGGTWRANTQFVIQQELIAHFLSQLPPPP